MKDILNIEEIKKQLTIFAEKREWNKFHSPKNLVMAAGVEMAEIIEIFQWITEEESFKIKDSADLKTQVSHEIADVFLYLIRLADILNIQLNQSLIDKININEKKYPLNLVKGSSKKYNQYKK